MLSDSELERHRQKKRDEEKQFNTWNRYQRLKALVYKEAQHKLEEEVKSELEKHQV